MVQRSRPLALAAFVSVALTTACNAAASAQLLPRLHVLSFAMKADTRTAMVGKIFHLAISGRVKERFAAVDFVVLPNLADLEPLGDERHALIGADGTSFSETLTVAPRHAGTIRLGGAYFDALDARDGKPKRYYSNDLVIAVGPATNTQNGLGSLTAVLARLVGALLIVFLLGAILLKRRPSRSPTVAAASPEPALQPVSSENGLVRALADLRAKRDRSAVMALREVMWKTAGGRVGETLSDLVSRNGITGTLRASLSELERAAFCSEERLSVAIDDAIAAVHRHLA